MWTIAISLTATFAISIDFFFPLTTKMIQFMRFIFLPLFRDVGDSKFLISLLDFSYFSTSYFQ